MAIHLVGNATDAEDLVQTTFLEAIRGAQRFTPGRPVMPWLASILAHRAANHRRSRSRAPAPLDPDLGLPFIAKILDHLGIEDEASDARARPPPEILVEAGLEI